MTEKKDTKFKPGTPKPPGSGRQKGQSNRVTLEMREFVKNLLEGEQERFQTKLESLDGESYCRVYLKLLEFVLPKQREISGELEIVKTQYKLPDGTTIEL